MPLLTAFDPWHSSLCTCPAKLTLNPYTGCSHHCVYCYATSYIPDFTRARPKQNLIQKLPKEAAHLKGQTVSMSNSSDPYPDIEAETRITRKTLKTLSQADCRIQVITKSTLVTRDIDILKKTAAMVSVTITTDNDSIARRIEPDSPTPTQRLNTVKTLIENGIPTTVRIDPIIPYVNDDPETLITKLAKLGVPHVTCSTYKAKPDNWKRLAAALPLTAEKLEPLFAKGERKGRNLYLPKDLRTRLLTTAAEHAKDHDIEFGTCREGLPFLNTAVCDGSWLLKERGLTRVSLASAQRPFEPSK